MKFTIFAFAVGAVGVSAQLDIPTKVPRSGGTPVERDVATISSVIALAGTNIAALDVAVKDFKAGDTASLTTLNSAAQKLSTGLTSGAAAIQASSNITINDAITLQSQVGSLQTSGSSLVSDLESKKADIQAAGLCDIVRQQVTDISNNGNTLIAAIVSKLPTEVQSIAQQQASGFVGTLKQTEGSFAQGNCTNGATSTTGGNGTMTGRPGSAVTAGASVISAAGSIGALAVAMAIALL